MIVLSYHRFFEEENEYRFSRTFQQFDHDVRKKEFSEINIDDGRLCSFQACEIAQSHGINVRVFISPSLIGTPGYLTWNLLRSIVKYGHTVENHSFYHENHIGKTYEWQKNSISHAQEIITNEIGISPSLFVAPFNSYDERTDQVISELGLIARKGRINVLNISK